MKIGNPGIDVELSDNSRVIVKQLPFMKAIELLKGLGKVADQLFDKNGRFKLYSTEKRADGNVVNLDLAPLQEVLQGSGELMAFVIMHSTKKDREWVENLSLAEGLAILKVALEQNLSPEILNLGKDVAGTFRAKIPATPTKSA